MEGQGPSLVSFLQQGDTPQIRTGDVGKAFQRRASNINLQKSIQLLDEAVSVVRPSQAPRGYKHLSGTPAHSDTGLHSRSNETLMFTPANNVLARFQSPTLRQEMSPLARSRAAVEETTFAVDATEDITSLGMTFIADEDPGKTASSGLFESFKNNLKQHQAAHQVMELLSGYESACTEQVTCLKKLSKSVTRNQPKLVRTTNTFEQLQHEKNTWKLLHSLFKDRLETEAKEDLQDYQMESIDAIGKTEVWSLSEQNIANQLLEKDSLVRQSQLVVDWLETSAAENLDTYFENAKFFVDQPVSWENTLHHLQKRKQGLRSSADRCITEMDPDAPLRQKRSLDDLDQEDDRFFTHHLYIFIRAGQLGKAQELCQACGQPWKSATLEGWRLLHDPNYYIGSSSLDMVPVEGNPYRDVWKAVCWRMASESDFDCYEKAVYGALSGNLQALLPVSSSWMDYLWAYYKVMVDIRVEQEVRLHHHTNRVLDSLPSEFLYSDKLLEPQEIFKDIAASINETVRLQSENWYHIIQKYAILGDIPALIEVMYSWLQKDRNSLPGHLVRLMAHIVLFLKTIGQSCKEELCEAIIEAYVKDLIRDKQRSLVAFYVATLSPPAQIQWYATFLEDVEDQAERKQCLSWAEEEGLDVGQITKTVVEKVRLRETKAGLPENSLAQDLTVTEDDREFVGEKERKGKYVVCILEYLAAWPSGYVLGLPCQDFTFKLQEDRSKIDAIEWLIFYKTHRSEALKQANAIMRSFIVLKKHAAARQAFEQLPLDTMDVIYSQWHLKTGSSELPPADNNAVREYMCIKAYLDAVESFNDWFSLYHQGQPLKPVGTDGGSFTDRVALEHKMKQYRHEYERWRHNLLLQARATRDRIYNVLLFADGGWLVDTFTDSDESRCHQMRQLRRLHLPGLCLNLHTVLHTTGMYAEALQIADIVASEQHQLYKEFEKDSLQHLLTQLSRSSHSLLDENKDPLGYEMV